MEFEWHGNDSLRTRSIRAAVAPHPVSGEPCWFAQPQHWHPSCLDCGTRTALQSLYAEAELPRNCYYGDGSPIDTDVMDTLLAIYEKLEVAFPWQTGDVLMLDNMLTAHGRHAFEGERRIMVAMADMISVGAPSPSDITQQG
jgi:alpha-ketoglutarate-dependent taurine dioxygenase